MFCRNILRWKGKGLIGLLMMGMAAIAALVAFVIVVLVALAALASATAAVIAYLKRESWTMPAYRWARDTSGGWSFTPWSGATGDAGEQVTGPAPSEEGAS
jgi:disulfide bond formation protein DsbB